MRGKKIIKEPKILVQKEIIDDVVYQELRTSNGVFVERYILSSKKAQREILIFAGLNIKSSTKYFGHFPLNLCKQIEANVSVVYELGCSGRLNRHFRKFTQDEAEEQFFAGFEIVKDFKGKIIIFSHSGSTIEHLKLIFGDKYKTFSEGLRITGAIVSAPVTNILLELKRFWPNYKFFSWKNIMRLGQHMNFPLPVYTFFRKSLHAKYSTMRNASIWINVKTAQYLLATSIKKIILNGERANYPLLVFISKRDAVFSPTHQKTVAKYMAKKANVTVVECDAEHNLFLSNGTSHISESIKEYVGKL